MPREKIYDGKLLFETYCGWGKAASNPRLMKFCESVYGTRSQMGGYYAMWKWAFRNPEESYPAWKEYYFEVHPEVYPQPTFQDYVAMLGKMAARNKGIGGVTGQIVKRFCARYGLDMDNLKIENNVKRDDVVQVTYKNHPLYQTLMIVDEIEGKNVNAHYFIPDRVYPEANGRELVSCKVGIREIGVVGKAIV